MRPALAAVGTSATGQLTRLQPPSLGPPIAACATIPNAVMKGMVGTAHQLAHAPSEAHVLWRPSALLLCPCASPAGSRVHQPTHARLNVPSTTHCETCPHVHKQGSCCSSSHWWCPLLPLQPGCVAETLSNSLLSATAACLYNHHLTIDVAPECYCASAQTQQVVPVEISPVGQR